MSSLFFFFAVSDFHAFACVPLQDVFDLSIVSGIRMTIDYVDSMRNFKVRAKSCDFAMPFATS